MNIELQKSKRALRSCLSLEARLDIKRGVKRPHQISRNQISNSNFLLPLVLNGDQYGPSFLETLPVDACNHGCEWCFTSDTRVNNILKSDVLRDNLQHFIDGGGRAVLFSGGGEPLLYGPLVNENHKEFSPNLIGWLSTRDVYTGIITNGINLAKFVDVNRMYLNRIAFIRVSLDATNNSHHSVLHSTSETDFDKIILGLEKLIESRGESVVPAIGISFVVDPNGIQKYEKRDLERIRDLSSNLGVDFVQIKHVHTKNVVAARKKMREISGICIDLDWQHAEFWIHDYTVPSPRSTCYLPMVGQVLGSKGENSPCCHMQGFELKNNLRKNNTEIVIRNCSSNVCRYTSFNDAFSKSIYSETSSKEAFEELRKSINEFGFHPYRFFPSAPTLLG